MKRIIATIAIVVVALVEVLIFGRVDTPKAWRMARR